MKGDPNLNAYLSLNVPDANGRVVCLGTVEDAKVVSQVARVVLGKGMLTLEQVADIIAEGGADHVCEHQTEEAEPATQSTD